MARNYIFLSLVLACVSRAPLQASSPLEQCAEYLNQTGEQFVNDPFLSGCRAFEHMLSFGMMLGAFDIFPLSWGLNTSEQTKRFVQEELKLNKVPDHSNVKVKLMGALFNGPYFVDRKDVIGIPAVFGNYAVTNIDKLLEAHKTARSLEERASIQSNIDMIRAYLSQASFFMKNNRPRKVGWLRFFVPLFTFGITKLAEKAYERRYGSQRNWLEKCGLSIAKGFVRFTLQLRIMSTFYRSQDAKADAQILDDLAVLRGYKTFLKTRDIILRNRVKQNYGIVADWLCENSDLVNGIFSYYYCPEEPTARGRIAKIDERIVRLEHEQKSVFAAA